MRQVVLDASVVFKWFSEDEEVGLDAARALQTQFQLGEIEVVVPYLHFLELINMAARRRAWSSERLVELAAGLQASRFSVGHPSLERVAFWVGRGMTAYDACYVALAEERRTVLITADERILALAGQLAEPLVGARRVGQ